jgi:FkbM family methyltransferase
MINYSQNSEQQYILNHFYGFTGTFLDIGANDGITLSNSYALVPLGWAGYLVEASPTAYERLLKTHTGSNRMSMYNLAVGSYDGEITLHESGELLGTGDIALVSSTKDEELKRWESLNMPFKPVIVPCVTFETLLKTMGQRHFDFVTIDIEGMEKEVVPQIDFNALGTKMAIIEFNGKDEWFYNNIMTSFGFSLTHKNAENLIFTR